MSKSALVKHRQCDSSKIEFELSNSTASVILKKAYVAPTLTALLNKTNIAGSTQSNVAEGTGGFLAVNS
jgi:hypothetical protein